jgi:hypothetical protein
MSGVQLPAKDDGFFHTCFSPALKLIQSPIQKSLLALTPTADFLNSIENENL